MYFPYFVAYIVIGLALALPAFFWALKRGQFKDQQRARYLPLDSDETQGNAKVSRFHKIEVYVLFLLALAGVVATAAVLIFAVWAKA